MALSTRHIILLILVITLFNLNIAWAEEQHVNRPHIVIIMADDMGFDDISFRGSDNFLTPNIDALAYSGVILQNLYTPSMCTPSRSALLTGRYPIHTGMQHYVIPNDQPWGLPLNETTMAEIFQKHGYYTVLLGKWHLGMSRRSYTPTMRGFDHFYGYLGSYIDYYDQTLWSPKKNYSRGHDFRDNIAVSRQRVGTYMTDLLTESAIELIHSHNVTEKSLFMILSHLAPHAGNEDKPLEAPEEEVNKFSYIKDLERRTYAAMMSLLDKSVGKVIDAISQKGILNNTIILFYSDNGGPTLGLHATTASNYPLRGQKNSPWEGGIRSSAAIWSPQFEKLGTVWKQKMYIADLLPTLTSAAGILDSKLKLDGLNLWSALKYGYESLEREILHNIDEIFNYVAYTRGKWKFVNGTTENGQYDGWLGLRGGENNTEFDPRAQNYEELIRNTTVWQQLGAFNGRHAKTNISELRAEAKVICRYGVDAVVVPCYPLTEPCLFDIDVDPCEQNNLYNQFKNTKNIHEILERIKSLRQSAVQPNNKPSDPNCDPKYYNDEWTWWQDVQEGNSACTVYSWKYFTLVLGNVILYLYL